MPKSVRVDVWCMYGTQFRQFLDSNGLSTVIIGDYQPPPPEPHGFRKICYAYSTTSPDETAALSHIVLTHGSIERAFDVYVASRNC